jgi:hypothetical protein
MATQDRRNFMALDEAYHYCRLLEAKAEAPVLYKLCAALRTVDSAVAYISQGTGYGTQGLSLRAWTEVRDALYNLVITSFAGYFLVYRDYDAAPIEPGQEWPEHGTLEFYPDSGRRRDDSYTASLEHLLPGTLTTLRWCYAEGRQQVTPADFPDETPATDEDDQAEPVALMDRLYEVCVTEATRGKKRAHERWWQLYWEANSSKDKREKSDLRKRMEELQCVWGRPS